MSWGIDVLTPTNQGDDPWKPVMRNPYDRLTFDDPEALFATVDGMKRGNANLQVRVVELQEERTRLRDI